MEQVGPIDGAEGVDDEFSGEIIMAVNTSRANHLGCSYYIARDSKLFIMSDISQGNLHLLESLKASIQPTVVILPLQISEQAESYFSMPPTILDSPADDNHADGLGLPYELNHRPTADFSYDAAKRRLIDIPLTVSRQKKMVFSTSVDQDSYEDVDNERSADLAARHARFLSMSGAVDFESRLSLGCAGAVLAYVARHKSGYQLQGDERLFPEMGLSQIQMFAMHSLMFIDEDTQSSLQILHTESSPNAHSHGPSKGASGAKEGLSVFGLFKRYCGTPQGKQLLRSRLSQPSCDPGIINERLNSIGYFLRAENQDYVKAISKDLKHVKNLRAVLINLKKGISNSLGKLGMRSSVWSTLRLAAYHSLQIREAFVEMSHLPYLVFLAYNWKILVQFDPTALALVGVRINETVDFGKSEESHRTVVSVGIDPDLDRLRHAYNGMEDMLNRVSREIASEMPATSEVDLSVLFLPQIGFLISVPSNKAVRRTSHEIVPHEADQWDPIFNSCESQYFKNARMRDLDETWGDVYGSICDKEIDIIHELALELLRHEHLLTFVSDLCGELDCILAFAHGAHAYNLCRPTLVAENVINIQGGRHFLQEQCVDSFVSNDTFILGGAGAEVCSPSSTTRLAEQEKEDPSDKGYPGARTGPSMMMMTGPNFSGKSVYLKQVAIIVYLAHVGCFVPAEMATIGLTDAILTRVTARDTVSRMQSSFMSDMQQIAKAMKIATRRSLILIDELGKGTEISDGIGIAAGVYKHLLQSDGDRPKIMAATHYHELFEIAALTDNPNLAFGFMDIWAEADLSVNDSSIIYLYKARSGRSSASHGLHCAARNGIDSQITTRAADLGDLDAQSEDLVAACATLSKREEEQLREAEEIAHDFLAQDFEALTAA